MVNGRCPAPGCDFQTGDSPAVLAAELMKTHTIVTHTPRQRRDRRALEVNRPEISDNIDEEAWNAIYQSWRIFVQANEIDDDEIAVQLYQCCKPSLKTKITAVHPDFLDKPAIELIPLLKGLTVTPVSSTVKQNELLQMKQNAGELIGSFYSRVKSKAFTCRLKVTCTHPHAQQHGRDVGNIEVSYTNEMIRHVILNGIYDDEIRREVFGDSRIDIMDLNELIKLVESKETARDATNVTNGAMSQYQKNQRSARSNNNNSNSNSNSNNSSSNNNATSAGGNSFDLTKKERCPTCSKQFNIHRKLRNGQINKKPFTECRDCHVIKQQTKKESEPDHLESSAITFEISGVSADSQSLDSAQPSPVPNPSVEPSTKCNDAPVLQDTAVTSQSSVLPDDHDTKEENYVLPDGQCGIVEFVEYIEYVYHIIYLDDPQTADTDGLTISDGSSHDHELTDAFTFNASENENQTPRASSILCKPDPSCKLYLAPTNETTSSHLSSASSTASSSPAMLVTCNETPTSPVLSIPYVEAPISPATLGVDISCTLDTPSSMKQDNISDKPIPSHVHVETMDNANSVESHDELVSVASYQQSTNTQFNAGHVILRHQVFQDGRWKSQLAKPHPTVSVSLSTQTQDYDQFNLKPPTLKHDTKAVTDSGAQVCVWGWHDCASSGMTRRDLIPVKQKLSAVSKSQIKIYGALLLRITGVSATGDEFCAAALVYVSPDVRGFYMSQDVMIQLAIIPPGFPCIGATQPNYYVDATETTNCEPCACKPRTLPPPRPDKLPMAATPENVEKMRMKLLEDYGDSVFNQCTHQPGPLMNGPPMRIHVDPNAEGTAVTVSAKVPIHWERQVNEDLERDVAMGIIERVPHGVPSKWIHRMLAYRKPNGNLRRVIDLSPLNKHCQREIHAMQSPFELAKGIPSNTWRTVFDAWNGFHSIKLHEEDRHLTTFLSNTGHRYRYCVAPQGYASSGDGYNRRCDEIFSSFLRHKRCVDDNLLYDAHNELEEHWWRVIDFLECCGQNGITLNPDKFQFCQKTVDFAGFRLTNDTIEPLPKYLDAIRHFPSPASLTDIRAWFGLVNQVAHYAQLRDMIEPFRKFLSPKVKFYWDPDLEAVFQESKDAIINAIKTGVQIFDLNRKTCLRSDWSKEGIGFYLCQKHCDCKSDIPDCCPDGWRIILCGSRFLKKSEERYAPIEGEALAVAWALQQTKYFTMGCDDLIVIVDHKPLTKILGDCSLDDIPNPRLFRLKQRTFPWKYEIEWLPGKNNSFSDAISRKPCSLPDDDTENMVHLINCAIEQSNIDTILDTHPTISAIKQDLNSVVAVTWERLQEASFEEFGLLIDTIHKGFPERKSDIIDPELLSFWEHRNNLHVYDDVVMFKDRAVIPPSLRKDILESIHAAHQGVSSMQLTAESAVFWPNISKDIDLTRNSCTPCNRNAPSQPKQPPVEPIIPTTPFECIVADYFEHMSSNYLVVGDRLSGWTECYHSKVVDRGYSSVGLIALLKRFFGTFGVPRELSSDGGPQFTADETQNFFHRWGIHHRLSSAHNPQSNGRAELAVKSTRRLIEGNVDQDGNLDTDAFLRAILIKRNTPDPTSKLSPADVVFGRKLRDTLPRLDKTINVFNNNQLTPTWREAWQAKEEALRTRYHGCLSRLAEHSRQLPPLEEGDKVMIQNQRGTKPTKWDRSGVVVEVRDFDKYIVKVDGSGRLTLRNRRYLKKIILDAGMFTSASIPPPRVHPVPQNNESQRNPAQRDNGRLQRNRRERLFYDADSGRYVPRNAGD